MEGMSYIPIAVSQTDSVLGFPSGKKGNFLNRLIISVATAATSTVSIKDGSGSAIVITAANTPIGVYRVEIEAYSRTGAWSVTTGAGATVLAIGRFDS